jgi:leader peptidase (prepilin peptidase)/N-methyltransferase
VVAAVASALLAVVVVINPRAPAGHPVGQSVPHGPSMLGATWLVTVVLLALGAGGGGAGR